MPPKPRPHSPKKGKPGVQLPSAGRKSLPMPLLLGAAGLIALVVILGVVLLGRGGGSGGSASSDVPQLMRDAGCSFQTVKSLPSGDHSVLTPDGTSKKWNTSPPTNGPHYQQWAIWGAYTEPLNPAQVVHNLEHGGIFIFYGSGIKQPTIDKLRTFYDAHLNATLLAPLPSLKDKIALGVWVTSKASTPNVGVAHLAKCGTFDEKAYSAFFDAYQFQGPERFPASQLTPGS